MGEDRDTIIRFDTYNICNGSNRVLDSALWGIDQANPDMGAFQDTKFTDGIYTRTLVGYRVFATANLSWHCRGGGGGILQGHPPFPGRGATLS